MSTLTIKSKRDGFRRAGIAFSATEATVLQKKDLKKEQIEALKEDPNLLVIDADDKPAKDDKAGKDDKPAK